MNRPKCVTLIILDGWGIRSCTRANAVHAARKPNFDRYLQSAEAAILDTSGEAVGLEDGQMGNSEVGHMNLGAGFVVMQDIVRIDRALRDGTFLRMDAFVDMTRRAIQRAATIHIGGLLSSGGVHSHERHLRSVLEHLAGQGIKVVIHVFTDGRDTPPQQAVESAERLEGLIAGMPLTSVASLSGRYYAMDRDKRWDRTRKTYDVINGRGPSKASSLAGAIREAYAAGTTDEFIEPIGLEGPGTDGRVKPPGAEDAFFFYNFRADRMRQLVRALYEPEFAEFPVLDRVDPRRIYTMTQYDESFPVVVVMKPQYVEHPLARVLSEKGLRQFHAAETEKYPHVTFFFNGRREESFPGEERLLIPSPKVATYDLKPEMSAYELADRVEARLESHDDHFVLVNFANPDMVGHTGSLQAAIRAVETADECMGKLVEKTLSKGGVALVTADHGNAERMYDEFTDGPHTAHTTGPVWCIPVSRSFLPLRPRGILADVAPTILDLLGIDKPEAMTGASLRAQAL